MKKQLLNIINWILHMIGYALILMTIAVLFKKSIYIDNSLCGLWCLIIAILVYIFNNTVKPLLFWLTLPITGLTLGLFYPFINLIILGLCAIILGDHFNITGGIITLFFMAILISIMRFVMDSFLKWLFRKEA